MEQTFETVARIRDDWYALCTSRELGKQPLRRCLFGSPLVLFRGEDGQPGALQDRCPHRNVPLSKGAVRGNLLQCVYHGWQFDRQGQCQFVPGLCKPHAAPGRQVARHAVREKQGHVWVYGHRRRGA